MSKIKQLFQKLCHVDPVSDNAIERKNNIDTADMIAALKEQLSGGEEMGLPSQDGVVLNPADPMSASNLSDGGGFKPVDPCGLGGPIPSAKKSLDKYLYITDDNAKINNRNDDNSFEIEMIKSSKSALWKIYCPESILNNSNYTGSLYGYVFDGTFSVLILDHPLYQRDELVIGFIEADDYPYPEYSSNKYFLSGKYEDGCLVLYLLYENFYFTGTIRWKDYHLDPNATEYDISVVEMRTILDSNLRRVCYSTKVTSYQNLTKWNEIIERKVDEWRIQIPQSIISNIDFDGAIFGNYQKRSRRVFIFDTVTFPEKKDDSKMIGYIHGKTGTSIAKLRVALQCDDFYISGEFDNSVLSLSIGDNSIKLSDRTFLNKEGFYRVLLHIRKACSRIIDEDEEELRFFAES